MEFQKMRPEMLSDRAKALNRRSVGVNVHDHMMFEFAIHKAFGESNVFDTYYLPELRKGGFQVFITTVGANSPCMCNLTDHSSDRIVIRHLNGVIQLPESQSLYRLSVLGNSADG